MLYTVFSYLPLIEEEVHTKKFELAKTQGKDEPPTGGDDDDEKGAEDLFHVPSTLNISIGEGALAEHRFYLSHYVPPSRELYTPPPRRAA